MRQFRLAGREQSDYPGQAAAIIPGISRYCFSNMNAWRNYQLLVEFVNMNVWRNYQLLVEFVNMKVGKRYQLLVENTIFQLPATKQRFVGSCKRRVLPIQHYTFSAPTHHDCDGCYKTGTHHLNEYSYTRLAATSVAITFRKTEHNLHRQKAKLIEEGAVSPLARGVCFT